jgi:hypothetical protein
LRDYFSNIEFDRQSPDNRRFQPHPASIPFSWQGGAGFEADPLTKG